jgi:type I restriction enzyme S subunit
MLKQYMSLAGGSTVNNLNKDLVSMTTVYVPCLEEQQKIAGFRSAYDEAISCSKQELDKCKELKKGLLQQMFV